MSEAALAARILELVRPEMTVALGDGAGAPGRLPGEVSVGAALSAAAAQLGSIRLVLGWLPESISGLVPTAFSDIVCLMPAAGARPLLKTAPARCVPARVSCWPALLAGALRPDVLITRLVEHDGEFYFGSEVSFQQALVASGVPVLAVVDTTMAMACAERPIPRQQVEILGYCDDGPAHQHREPDRIHEDLADAVLRFVPAEARVQYGPGPLGTALLRSAAVPLAVDTGLLTDAVVDLDRRGLLRGVPSATYLVGTSELYEWSAGRPILRGIDYTHDLTRLSRGAPFVAVNTAIEIDPVGQINVEGVDDTVVGGIGGHPDFCIGARMHRRGLSIIAVPTTVNGRSPLVERLSRPASTAAADIDLIVTERGHADLRTAEWSQRRRMIAELFGA